MVLVWNQGSRHPCSLWGHGGRILPRFFLISDGCHSLTCSFFCLHLLCVLIVSTRRLLSVSISDFSPYQDNSYWIKVTLIRCDLILINYICKGPISNYGYISRYLGLGFPYTFWEDTIQPTRPLAFFVLSSWKYSSRLMPMRLQAWKESTI